MCAATAASTRQSDRGTLKITTMSASNPNADYMAKILALGPHSNNLSILMTAMNNWHAMCDNNPQYILAEIFRDFSAKYLIQFMDMFDEVKTSHSTLYTDVMRAISRNCYWGRFQQTHPRGRGVLPEHARRISETAVGRPRDDQGNFSQSIMLLWQLLAWDNEWPPRVPDDVAKNIIRMIKEFLRDCPGAMGTSIAEDCMFLLQGPDEGAIFRIKLQRSQWETDMVSCLCGVRTGLSRCSKCKIVAYCCPEHQRSDWSKHKSRCIKPSFE